MMTCGWGSRNIDDVDKTMDEINEQTENMKQIQDALAQPVGAMADIDDVRGFEGEGDFVQVLIVLVGWCAG